jgi:hypothetical protein
MSRPAATIKSSHIVPGRRAWKVQCFLHYAPLLIGMFGTPGPWLITSHSSRKTALAALAMHQRSAHPCIDCHGLACPTCKGTCVDLTHPATAEETP